jgi:dTMP kinase
MMFIVFEGLDSSGKKTQVEILKHRLENQDLEVEYFDFPAYATPLGQLVGAYLRGDYGPKEQIPAESASLLFATDRYQFKARLQELIKAGRVVISNRYTQSNLGFQAANFSGRERDRMIRWIEAVESRLPQPDLVIFLDVPVSAAASLLEGRAKTGGRAADIHERDRRYQEKVRKNYLSLARRGRWLVIRCARRTAAGWEVLPPEEISEKIWARVKKLL